MAKFYSPINQGAVLTSHYGRRWLWGKWGRHDGTDWAMPPKQSRSPIYPIAKGRVIAAGTGVLAYHSGNIVIVDHGNGVASNYGHLARIDVHVGQVVQPWDVLGLEGATGNVTAAHLHLGIRVNGVWQDPYKWLLDRGVRPGQDKPATKPVSVPTAPVQPAGKKAGYSEDNVRIQQALSRMGLYNRDIDGVNGPRQKAAVSAYQRLNGLVEDGHWGPKTQQKFEGNKKIQRALNRMRWSSGGPLVVDGHIPPSGLTRKRIADVRRRNGLGSGTGFSQGLKDLMIRLKIWN